MRRASAREKNGDAPIDAATASPRDVDPAAYLHIASVLRAEGDPVRVLRALDDADLQLILERCARRLRDRSLLLDVHRLHSAALVTLARCLERSAPAADVVRWIDVCIDEAVADLVREDAEEELSGLIACEPEDDRYAFLSRGSIFDAARARRAAVAFNQLHERSRKAFFALFVERKSVEACLVAGMGPRKQLLNDVRRAVRSLLTPLHSQATRRENWISE